MSDYCARPYGHVGPCSPTPDFGLCAGQRLAMEGPCSPAYDTLTRPWGEVIGPIHPDDPDMRRGA